ncbi:hypothetical protein ACVFYP_24920 [Roseomonas sp. F4]
MGVNQGGSSGRRRVGNLPNWREMAQHWGKAGPAHAARPRSPRPARPPAPPEACASWSPMDGDAMFKGAPGMDVLALRHVSLSQLVYAINILEPGLSLHLDQDGGIGFLNRMGEATPFSGDLTLNDSTLRFHSVSKLLLG